MPIKRNPLSPLWARVLLTIVSFAASMAFAEVLTRTMLPRPGFERIPDQPSIIPHSTRGYAYSPNHPGFTNSLGIRDQPIAPDETIHILAVGDSFTVAGGLQLEEAWPSQLQLLVNSASALPFRVRVLNAGVPAYNLNQIRMLTSELADEFKPQVIVLGLLSSRYWRLDDPYVFFHGAAVPRSEVQNMRVVNGSLIHTPFKTRWLKSFDFFLAEHFYFGAHLLRQLHYLVLERHVDEGLSRPSSLDIENLLQHLLNELQKMHNLSVALKTQLVVMLINEQEKDGRFKWIEKQYNEVVKTFCSSRGIKVLDPLPAFEKLSQAKPVFRMGDDHHWSKLAHSVAARELLRFLREEHMLTSLRRT